MYRDPDINSEIDAAWCSQGIAGEWMRWTLNETFLLTSIETRGGKQNPCCWVESYYLNYSIDGSQWTSSHILTGNTAADDTASIQMISPPLTARYIELRIQSWNVEPCMRVEMYGYASPDPNGRRLLEELPPPSQLPNTSPPPPPSQSPSGGLCSCEADYFAVNTTVLECAPCPSGARCARHATVETLVIRPGHFRPTLTTADVRPCPNHTTEGFLQLSAPSGCAGGKGAGDELCRPGLGGLFCQSCNASMMAAGGHYYDAAAVECRACSATAAGAGVWVLVGVLALALVAAAGRHVAKAARSHRIRRLLSLLRRLRSSAVLGSLGLMAKILVELVQLVAEFEELFDITLPSKVTRFIGSLSWLRLNLDSLLPLQCLGLGDYTNQLLLTVSFPAALVLVAALAALVREAVFLRTRGRELARAAGLRALRWTLLITFLVFPDVCAQAFQVFRCECWDDAAWLIADYAMQCTAGGCPHDAGARMTPEYAEAHGLAWSAIIVYAMGVPSMYALLLLAVRRSVIAGESTPLADSLAFLDDGYRPRYYWWEIVSTLHKLTVVGFATFMYPGTMMQPVVVMVIVAAYTLLLLMVRPHKDLDAFVLALVGQMSLLVFVVLCIIAKAEQLSQQVATLFTPAVHRAFFHNTESMADLMLGSLVAAFAVAVALGMRKVEVVISSSWSEQWAFDDDASGKAAAAAAALTSPAAAARRAARHAARGRLQTVLARRAAKLEVSALLLEMDLNPVQWQRVQEADEAARRADGRLSAGGTCRPRGGGAGPSRRKTSALAKLNFSLSDEGHHEPTQLARAGLLHRRLQASERAVGLLPERMLQEESAELLSRIAKASKGSATTAPQVRVRTAARARLEGRGWRGAEYIDGWELLRLERLRRRQAQDATTEEVAEVAPETMGEDGEDQEAGEGQAGQRLNDALVAPAADAASSASSTALANSSAGSGGGTSALPLERPALRRPRPGQQSLEQKFTGSLREMGHHIDRNLGDGLVLTEAAAAAAQREMSRRKRRLSLTEGDDQWENMVVKDRPRRETNRGLERDHTPLEAVRGRRGGSASERSLGERGVSQRERSVRERSVRERSMRERSTAEGALQSSRAGSHRGSTTVGRGATASQGGASAESSAT